MPAEESQGLVEAVPVPLTVLQAIRDEESTIIDFVIEFMNLAGQSLVGVPRERLIGQRLKDVVPGIQETGLFDDYTSVVADGGTLVKGPFPFEGEVAGQPLSGYFDQHVARYQDGVIVLSMEVTASVRAHEMAMEVEGTLLQRQAAETRARGLAEEAVRHLGEARNALDSGQHDLLQEILETAQRSTADVVETLRPLD